MNLNQNIPCSRKALPFVAMTVAQFMLIGSTTLSKAAMKSGLNQYVFVAYYEALGTLIFLPCFLHHCLRGKRLPLTLSLFFRFFALSLIGSCLSPICLFAGLNFTAVTVGASIGNLTPIFTYLIAICLRMETMDLRKFVDQIKALGTFIAVLGALVVTLYKGPTFLVAHSHLDSASETNWPLGCLLLTLGFLLRSIWTILQADTAKLYPDEVTIVFLTNLFGTIQTAAASFFLVKRASEWQIHHRIQIIAIVYAGFSLSVLVNTFITWCLRKKGPVFVCMFDPLNVAIAAFMGHVFLGDGVYLGSVVGSATIVVGFYAVIWGQVKTTVAKANEIGGLESSQVTPLLQKLT